MNASELDWSIEVDVDRMSIETNVRDFFNHAMKLAEREDFVIEATSLMHDRLLQTPVFERIGFDGKRWSAWAAQNEMQHGFRQRTFSKIVPNLKRLGLLTPRVRDHMEKLNLLKFEHEQDSVADPSRRSHAALLLKDSAGVTLWAL